MFFFYDKAIRDMRGLYSHFPAQSCKDIRDSGNPFGNRKYWIDPEQSGHPLEVYCDMTTNGGEKQWQWQRTTQNIQVLMW